MIPVFRRSTWFGFVWLLTFLAVLFFFLAYIHPPLLFLTTPSAIPTTHKAKAWHIIKMLRGNFIWTHKPEHLLTKAGARRNTLRQLGSASRVISHAVAQPPCVGAQRVSAVPPGSTCCPELALSSPHAALANTPEPRAGQTGTQAERGSVANHSHSLTLTVPRAALPLHCSALLSRCSATITMRSSDGYGRKRATACVFSSSTLSRLLLDSVEQQSSDPQTVSVSE